MAATTISRATWTDDSGTPASPVGDGTIINNARLQADVYDKIDALFTAAFTFGGLVHSEGFGTHLWSTGGTGGNQLSIRNTTAGTGNYAGFLLGNNAAAGVGVLTVQSSTFTTTSFNVQDGMTLGHTRAGGISIAASHANGMLRFYSGGGAEGMRLTDTAQLLLGHTTNGEITGGGIGILSDDQSIALALKGSLSDVTHGITVITVETNTFGALKQHGAGGGLHIAGFRENGSGKTAIVLSGYLGDVGDTTKSTAGVGVIQMRGGSNFAASMSANENILAVDDGSNTRFILDADGDSHQDVGTAWTNFHGHDDISLLNTLSAHLTRRDDPLRVHFADWLESSREPLERMKLVTFNANGHHFVNWSRMHMLKVGAILQLAARMQRLEAELGLA
jgi:hypothetical protein